MQMMPRTATITESNAASVKGVRVELWNADHSTLLNSVNYGTAPGGVYPWSIDIGGHGDEAGHLYEGIAPGTIVTFRSVETGHDDVEYPSAFTPQYVVHPVADGAEGFSITV